MQQTTSTLHDEANLLDTTGLCLLSLDGGGVRGLSTLYILKSIMDRLNHGRKTANLPPVKPCEVFDLIGGTSTAVFRSAQPILYPSLANLGLASPSLWPIRNCLPPPSLTSV